jgi:hypothetical protein
MATLTALGGDPTACGYTLEQVERCLADLPERGPWQEPVALRHLAFLLHQRGRLSAARVESHAAEPCEEVMKLRFDAARSAADDVPEFLRRPLYAILLEHAAGAVQRAGEEWIGFDPLSAPRPSPAEGRRR